MYVEHGIGGFRVVAGTEFKPQTQVELDGGILKQVEVGRMGSETRYSVPGSNSYITGFKRRDGPFHISRIRSSEGGLGSLRFLSSVYSTLVDDLRREGVEKITTTSLIRLAPIAMERYGFQSERGWSVERVRHLLKGWRGKIPGYAVSLCKTIENPQEIPSTSANSL